MCFQEFSLPSRRTFTDWNLRRTKAARESSPHTDSFAELVSHENKGKAALRTALVWADDRCFKVPFQQGCRESEEERLNPEN